MNIHDGRTLFASCAQMLRTVRMSFKNMYAEDDLKCICGEDDHLGHLHTCLSYLHLHQGLCIYESDHDLVILYQRIIREREENEGRK